MWSDNADVMSYLYTGTPALKTDFTRTGARTFKGSVDDGINSLTRYYINNFTDGAYVDCLDFLTQRLTVDHEFKKRAKFFTPIKVQFLVVTICFYAVRYGLNNHWWPAAIKSEAAAETWSPYIFYWVVYLGAMFAGFFSIFGNGLKYIDDCTLADGEAPRLKQD